MISPQQFRQTFPAWFGSLILLAVGSFPVLAQEYQDSEEEAPESLKERARPFDEVTITDEIYEQSYIFPALIDSFPPLEPVVRDSYLSFEPRSYYFHRKFSDGRVAEAWAMGGAASYQSGWWRDILKWGVTVYTSQRLYGPLDRDGTGLLQLNQQPYSALGQAYLKVKLRHSVATLYRQEIDIPYINRNDIRMTPRTFEGYTITSEEFDRVKLIAGHLTEMKDRTSDTFEPLSVAAGAPGSNEGVTLGGVSFEFTENLRAGVVNSYGWDTFNFFYSEAEVDHSCSLGPDLSLGLQFADQRSVGSELAGTRSGQLFGAEASAGYNSLIGSVAFTTTTGDRITKPWGGDPSYNSLMISDFDSPDENTFRVGLSCDFKDIGLPGFSAFTNYAWGNSPDSGPNATPDQQEFNVTFDFRPDVGELRAFWLRFRYGYNDRESAGISRNDFRVIANYSIDF